MHLEYSNLGSNYQYHGITLATAAITAFLFLNLIPISALIMEPKNLGIYSNSSKEESCRLSVDLEINSSDPILLDIESFKKIDSISLNNRIANFCKRNATINNTCISNPDYLTITKLDNSQEFKKRFIIQISTTNNKSDKDSLWPTFLGGILTLFGVLVTQIWSERNQSARNRFEWGKFLFERYEKNYIEFIRNTEGTSSSIQIKRYFDQLDASAFVPQYLRLIVMETIKEMDDKEISSKQKQANRDNLVKEFNEFMQSPWAGTTPSLLDKIKAICHISPKNR